MLAWLRRLAGQLLGDGTGHGVTHGELDRADVIRLTVEGIGTLARSGDRGVKVFPDAVRVKVRVAEGSVGTVRHFLDVPSFDAAVGERLRNEHPEADGVFPLRSYEVEAGASASGVDVLEAPAPPLRLVVSGGDLDGTELHVPRGRRVLYVGRSPWHGEREGLRNDLNLTDTLTSVPRQAFRVERRGASLLLYARSADDSVEVQRGDGSRLRPSAAPAATVELRSGDRVAVGPDASRIYVHVELGDRP